MTIKEDVGRYVSEQIHLLISIMNHSSGRAKLANLRRGVGKMPGELPDLWGAFLNDLPESILENDYERIFAEWAIYLSLTLFALHQQSNSRSVHEENISLGKAASYLIENNNDQERERILHRFEPIVTAKDMPELSHHIRGFIQLLRSKGIKLDYVMLAKDIYEFQSDDKRKSLLLRWGRDFYNN